MKIEPRKDLKKPAYAIGAAMLAATFLTGCPSDKSLKVRRGSGTPPITETELIIEGEIAEPDPTEEFVLDGDVAVVETEEELILDGDVSVDDNA